MDDVQAIKQQWKFRILCESGPNLLEERHGCGRMKDVEPTGQAICLRMFDSEKVEWIPWSRIYSIQRVKKLDDSQIKSKAA